MFLILNLNIGWAKQQQFFDNEIYKVTNMEIENSLPRATLWTPEPHVTM